jgi:hypothetical protein
MSAQRQSLRVYALGNLVLGCSRGYSNHSWFSPMIYFLFPQVQHGITPLSYRQDDESEDKNRQNEDAETGE